MKYVFKKRTNALALSLVDGIGYPLSRLCSRRAEKGADFKNILVIRMDHLGDVLLATPLPKILKESYPQCHLIFITSSWSVPLLENNPFIDELLIYDAPWFAKRRYRRSPKSLGFFQLVRLLRRRNIDLGIGLRGDLRENMMLALGGVKERLGYGITGGGFFLTQEARYRPTVHESEHLADLVRLLGIPVNDWTPQLYFSEEELAASARKAKELGFREGGRYLGFQVEAGSDSKNWPIEHILEFVRAFGNRFPGFQLAFVGTDRRRMDQILPEVSPRAVDLVGKTSLRELCLLMKRFLCFIGLDSGPSHIAAALGIPVLFLYSGTNRFEQWRPLGERSLVLRHEVPCSPCGLEVCNVRGHPCLTEITPEKVLSALGEFSLHRF